MFTYYLCEDNDTIYKMEFSLKEDKINYYLSLLERYLEELVFIEEIETKKLLAKDKIEQEKRETINNENNLLFLERTEVINSMKIEDNLPYVITIKIRKYAFLRPYNIFMLVKLLSNYLTNSNNPYIGKVLDIFNKNQYSYIDFSSMYAFFFAKRKELIKTKALDYNSLQDLFRSLDINITTKYSLNELLNFWNGDDAERALADSIVRDATANKKYLKKFNFAFLPINEQQLLLKRR